MNFACSFGEVAGRTKARSIYCTRTLTISSSTMKVSLIGAGAVGKSLANACLENGVEVKMGVRDPSKKPELVEQYKGKAEVTTISDAVAWADVNVLATPGLFSDELLDKFVSDYGTLLDGKVVVDATNPFPPRGEGFVMRVWSTGVSGAEELQERIPGAHFYKAFNTIGEEHMSKASPDSMLTREPLVMLYCGGEEHKATVEDLITGTGWLPKYVGPIRYARNLEAIAELWTHMRVMSVMNHPYFHFQYLESFPEGKGTDSKEEIPK